ncbi:MAG TPA: hemerythrin domain-containing protein [Bacteroidales bacterium]|nr:hemerythrin domain-containing protein [Bacteroidales bacterium]
MDIFKTTDPLADVINKNVDLIPVINRFGIKLGFQNKTIEEVCKAYRVNPDFFLTIINTYHNEGFFPESSLKSFSPLSIVEYLKKTHTYYINYVLPRTKDLLEDLLQGCSGDCEELKLIRAFYRKYEEELLHHLDNEDRNVFPYIETLIDHPEQVNTDYTISDFEKEHTNVDVKINDLKQLIIKYIHPTYDINQCNEFLNLLFRFEKDLKDHARIEDNVLVPMVMEIEKSTANG